MLPQTVKEEVRVKLLEKEIRVIAETLARKIGEKKQLEDEKKSLVSEMAAKINEANAAINYLAHIHNTGHEMRTMECSLEYDVNDRTRKTVHPITGETIATRPLESWEYEELRQPKLPGV
jgi:hypothetical protein